MIACLLALLCRRIDFVQDALKAKGWRSKVYNYAVGGAVMCPWTPELWSSVNETDAFLADKEAGKIDFGDRRLFIEW